MPHPGLRYFRLKSGIKTIAFVSLTLLNRKLSQKHEKEPVYIWTFVESVAVRLETTAKIKHRNLQNLQKAIPKQLIIFNLARHKCYRLTKRKQKG